jgi:hypothetical protein
MDSQVGVRLNLVAVRQVRCGYLCFGEPRSAYMHMGMCASMQGQHGVRRHSSLCEAQFEGRAAGEVWFCFLGKPRTAFMHVLVGGRACGHVHTACRSNRADDDGRLGVLLKTRAVRQVRFGFVLWQVPYCLYACACGHVRKACRIRMAYDDDIWQEAQCRDAQYAVRPVRCTLYVVRCTLVGGFCTHPLYVPVRWHWATRLLLLLLHH